VNEFYHIGASLRKNPNFAVVKKLTAIFFIGIVFLVMVLNTSCSSSRPSSKGKKCNCPNGF